MYVAAANENPVEAVIGVEPAREVKSGFDEQELAVSVPCSNGEVWEPPGDFEEEEDDEPLVVEVVAEPELAMEVGKMVRAEAGRFGKGRYGESEGLVLPYIVSSEGRESFEDLKVQRLQ